MKILLCSECFRDEGLKLDARQIGYPKKSLCPNCKSKYGTKLDKTVLEHLAYRFFVRGTLWKVKYGVAPLVQFNNSRHGTTEIQVSKWLKDDIKLIEESIKVGFFYYGPRLWMLGEVEPLKALQIKSKRNIIIERIIKEYPTRIISKEDTFYRIRKNPKVPTHHLEYDSPPDHFLGSYRMDSKNLPILYGSQDLEVCVHECRVTVDDELYVATLVPTKKIKLLDLTEILIEDKTEFESLDMAVHMLFSAGKHSYKISREIALTVKDHGFDGIIYPSYFSDMRTGNTPLSTIYGMSVRKINLYHDQIRSLVIPNIALFGRPVQDKRIKVKCINKLIINQVSYGLQFGPAEIDN